MLANIRSTNISEPADILLFAGGLILAIVTIAGMWKTHTKAGEPGWSCLVPIYNIVVLLRMAGKPWWWLLLLLIPLINFFILLSVYIGLARNFGKGVGFGLGLVFLSFIFYIILGFGDAQYQRAVVNEWAIDETGYNT
jgi:hypothetical protein